MEKLIIWGKEKIWRGICPEVEHILAKGDTTVLGASFFEPATATICAYPLLASNSPLLEQATCFLLCTDQFNNEAIQGAVDHGIPREKMIPLGLIRIPGFSFGRYMNLVRSRITILSNYCWGGLTYHYFNLKFMSPTINLFIVDNEYLTFLENLDRMLTIEPVFVDTEYNDTEELHYPVFSLEGVKLHMNHCRDRELGLRQWKERCTRVNRDNMLVMMITRSPSIARRFTELSFSHKICFVPFKTDLPDCVTVDPGNSPLVNFVNSFATGARSLYDPWVLLGEGRIEYTEEWKLLDPKQKVGEVSALIHRTTRILIYGAWALGNRAYDYVEKCLPHRLQGFMVTSMEGNPEQKNGYPVHDISAWGKMLEKAGISGEQVLVVLGLHPRFYQEVEASLRSVGLKNYVRLEDLEWYLENRPKD